MNRWVKGLFRAIAGCSLLVGIAASAWVGHRHYLALRGLPKIELSPRSLPLPLTLSELAAAGMRWVEVEATPSGTSSGENNKYREAMESPGSLILQLKRTALAQDNASPGKAQKYRGILYTALTRYRPDGIPDPLIRELNAAGIRPAPRFAVLLVDESPWLIWKAVLKELGVLLSALLIIALFLIQGIRVFRGPVRRQIHSAVSKQIHSATARFIPIAIAASAVAWAIYFSLRTRPVLPIVSILGFGFYAGLRLILESGGKQRRNTN